MGILTDIYNTVAKFFRPQDLQADEEASKSVAQNRLKLVLMQDRTNLTPKVLEQMRGEMIDLLSKYLEMDKDLLELNFEQEGDQVALMLSIPVIRAKDEDEIEAALNAEEEKEEDVEDVEEDNEADDEDESEESEEVVSEENSEEEAPKPKKRRSKKVTPPENLEEKALEEESAEENQEEKTEDVCENIES